MDQKNYKLSPPTTSTMNLTIKFCTILILINIVNVTCDTDNNFKSVPTTIKTFENDSVLLPCNHEKPFRYIRWLFQDFLLVDTKIDEFSTPPERMHLWPNGSLQVINLKEQDTGEYYCQMMTIGGLAQQTHAIEVQYPASAEILPNGVIETYVGSVVELICESKGVPLPIISWKQQDLDYLENNNRLLVEINNKDQSGSIECQALNNVGEPAVASVLLLVQFAPEVTTIKSIVHTQTGLKAEMECIVYALPRATVHWFHNDSPMVQDNRITKIDTDLTNKTILNYYTIHKHTLRIRAVKDTDLGRYECRAENKIGFKGIEFELTGQPMPSSFKLSPVPSMHTSYNLIWQTESFSRIHEYKLRFRKVPSGNVTPNNRFAYIPWTEFVIPSENAPGPIHGMGYSLKGLVPGSVYEVVVLAKNKYGWSDESKILRFATTGDVEPTNGYTTELYEENEISELSSSYYDYDSAAVTIYASLWHMILLMLMIFTVS